jgi:hypothetical protein
VALQCRDWLLVAFQLLTQLKGTFRVIIAGTEDWRRREKNLGADFEKVRGLRIGQREGGKKVT